MTFDILKEGNGLERKSVQYGGKGMTEEGRGCNMDVKEWLNKGKLVLWTLRNGRGRESL